MGRGKPRWRKTLYTYKPLDPGSRQIRTLNLKPHNGKGVDADIHCSLQLETLDEGVDQGQRPKYFALSYAWGDASATKYDIYVDGFLLQVTLNLYVALRHLRSNRSNAFWIDAICINQADDAERSQQVCRMYEIYSHATGVLIWLGESNKEIDKAMDFLRNAPDRFDECELPLRGLEELFAKSWWSRMWGVQELFATKQPPWVGSGHLWIEWLELASVGLQMAWEEDIIPKENGWFLKYPYPMLKRSMFWWEADRTEFTLEYLLVMTSDRDAQDPRDHIFAIWGLMSKLEREKILPDYSESEHTVYQKTMALVISDNVDFLVCATMQKTSGLPTWCIDFSKKRWDEDAAFFGWYGRPGAKANACGQLSSPGSIHDSLNATLTLTGTTIGSIQYAIPSKCMPAGVQTSLGPDKAFANLTSEQKWSRRSDNHTALILEVGHFTQRVHEALKSRVSQAEAIKTLAAGDVWKALISGDSLLTVMGACDVEERHAREAEVKEHGFSLVEEWARRCSGFYERVSDDWKHLLPELTEVGDHIAINAIINIASKTVGGTYWTTDTGYFGSAGQVVQEGDLVCILYGCKHPAVLRPCGGKFELVTFTYTHSVMDGQFVADATRVKTREFCLR